MIQAFLLFACLSQASYRDQYPLPGPTVSEGLGVNIHIVVPHDDSIPMLAKTGFKWIRMDMAWETVEHQKGAYDFSGYDKLVGQLHTYMIRPLFILDYGNHLYQEGSPRSDEARAGFVAFVHATLRHYRHQGVVWEMFNEPNIQFWKPKPNVDEYIKLAKEVGHEIRANEPDEWYIGPGVAGMDMTFLTACLDAGMLDYWDAVSVHPYRSKAPETVTADYKLLQGAIKEHAPGKRIPVICSEWGYTDYSVGQAVQSEYIAREYLNNLASGIPITIWYDWSDDVLDQRNPGEAHFGVVSHDLSDKPAHTIIQSLVQELGGWTYSKDVVGDGPYRILEFRRGASHKLVAWAVKDPVDATIDLKPGEHRVIELGGDGNLIPVEGSGLPIQLGPIPMVISVD